MVDDLRSRCDLVGVFGGIVLELEELGASDWKKEAMIIGHFFYIDSLRRVVRAPLAHLPGHCPYISVRQIGLRGVYQGKKRNLTQPAVERIINTQTQVPYNIARQHARCICI